MAACYWESGGGVVIYLVSFPDLRLAFQARILLFVFLFVFVYCVFNVIVVLSGYLEIEMDADFKAPQYTSDTCRRSPRNFTAENHGLSVTPASRVDHTNDIESFKDRLFRKIREAFDSDSEDYKDETDDGKCKKI